MTLPPMANLGLDAQHGRDDVQDLRLCHRARCQRGADRQLQNLEVSAAQNVAVPLHLAARSLPSIHRVTALLISWKANENNHATLHLFLYW